MTRARKQTSDRVARLAASWLAQLQHYEPKGAVTLKVSQLKALCASVLSQDETRGPRRRKKVRK